MALSPGNPDTFIREVDDAVRADQLGSFFTRFGKPLLAIVIVGLLAFAGYLFWQNRNAEGDAALGGKFSTALDSLDQCRPKAASTAMEPIATGANPIYRALALISHAIRGRQRHARGQPRPMAPVRRAPRRIDPV